MIKRRKYKDVPHAAVRAFHKIHNRKVASIDEAERCDAGFDRGEFSSKFYSTAYGDAWEFCLHEVARRFGVDVNQLEMKVMLLAGEQQEHWLNQERFISVH